METEKLMFYSTSTTFNSRGRLLTLSFQLESGPGSMVRPRVAVLTPVTGARKIPSDQSSGHRILWGHRRRSGTKNRGVPFVVGEQ